MEKDVYQLIVPAPIGTSLGYKLPHTSRNCVCPEGCCQLFTQGADKRACWKSPRDGKDKANEQDAVIQK